MEKVKVKIKRTTEHAFLPTRASEDAAGYDLYAVDQGYYNQDYDFVEFGTGIAMEIPKGYAGFIYPRSSVSKTPHILSNCVGVIDSDYRGEIKFRFRNLKDQPDLEYGFGDRIGQIVIKKLPEVEFEEVTELDSTDRGEGGFGSSGR